MQHKCALLIIEDHGMGVPDTIINQVLINDEKQHSYATYHGAAIGLKMVRDITLSHGGIFHINTLKNEEPMVDVCLPTISVKDQGLL